MGMEGHCATFCLSINFFRGKEHERDVTDTERERGGGGGERREREREKKRVRQAETEKERERERARAQGDHRSSVGRESNRESECPSLSTAASYTSLNPSVDVPMLAPPPPHRGLVCLVGFLPSSSTTRLYRGRAPRQSV